MLITKDSLGEDCFVKTINDLRSDFEFFRMYMERNQRAEFFKFDVCSANYGGELFNLLWEAYDRDLDSLAIVFSFWRAFGFFVVDIQDNNRNFSDDERRDFFLFFKREFNIEPADYVRFFIGWNVDATVEKVREFTRVR